MISDQDEGNHAFALIYNLLSNSRAFPLKMCSRETYRVEETPWQAIGYVSQTQWFGRGLHSNARQSLLKNPKTKKEAMARDINGITHARGNCSMPHTQLPWHLPEVMANFHSIIKTCWLVFKPSDNKSPRNFQHLFWNKAYSSLAALYLLLAEFVSFFQHCSDITYYKQLSDASHVYTNFLLLEVALKALERIFIIYI